MSIQMIATNMIAGHQYDWYDARKSSIELRYIASSEKNAEILRTLRSGNWGDLERTLTLFADGEVEPENPTEFVARAGDDMAWLGYFIGRSKKLHTLHIMNLPEDRQRRAALMEGIKCNQSIRKLQIAIDLGNLGFRELGIYLKCHHNLTELIFSGPDIDIECTRNIATIFSRHRFKSLKILNFCQTELGDDGLANIIGSMSTQPQLEELHLEDNSIGNRICVALGSSLETWVAPNLKRLDLSRNNIDDKGLQSLVAGMLHCCLLENLDLSENLLVTTAGLRALSALFQSSSCCLERLDLHHMNIDDAGASALADGLTGNNSLKLLSLGHNVIGDDGLRALVGFASHSSLKGFFFTGNDLITSAGLWSLSLLALDLTSLSLSGINMNDEGLQALVTGISRRSMLKELDLSHNELITIEGLICLSTFFQTETCCLETLFFFDVYIGDGGAAALAGGLVGNKSLKQLMVDTEDVTESGWSVCSSLLCDTSNINNTYFSNHTLEYIGSNPPPAIKAYLEVNRDHNSKANAAICKILMHHSDFDIEPLFRWKLKFLPLIVAWFERASPCRLYLRKSEEAFEKRFLQSRELSAVFKFVRGLPLLLMARYRSKEANCLSRKRKKCDQRRTLC